MGRFKMNKLLQFHELKEGVYYRLLHNGRTDSGYTYELRAGRLYNANDGNFSRIPFSKDVRFIEENIKFKEYESIDREVEFYIEGIKLGCQNITKEDAIRLANDIIDMYDESLNPDDIPF